MQLEIYQWLVPIIGIYYILRVVLQFRANKRGAMSMVIWLAFWSTITILAIIPNPVSFEVARILGFKSNINAIIFVAIGWLFLLNFYLSSTIDRLEKQVTELVRKLALEEAERKKPKEDDQGEE